MNLEQALERIRELEASLEQSKASHKRIKADCRYIDYNRLLDRFNRQKTQNLMFRDTLNYIGGNSHLTTDTLQEAREAANRVLEEAGE